jgi:hypothetical protein
MKAYKTTMATTLIQPLHNLFPLSRISMAIMLDSLRIYTYASLPLDQTNMIHRSVGLGVFLPNASTVLRAEAAALLLA